jgi:hypothetical protein
MYNVSKEQDGKQVGISDTEMRHTMRRPHRSSKKERRMKYTAADNNQPGEEERMTKHCRKEGLPTR